MFEIVNEWEQIEKGNVVLGEGGWLSNRESPNELKIEDTKT